MLINKKILFLCYFGNLKGDITEQLLNTKNYSPLASVRLQILPALQASISLGCDPRVFSIQTDHCINEAVAENPKLCILGPTFPTPKNQDYIFRNHIKAITQMKKNNSKIAAIYADNHVGTKSKIDYFYQAALKKCNYVVTPTSSLKKIISESDLNLNTVHHILDPWQIPEEIAFTKKGSEYKKILWFGSASNLVYLDRVLKQFKKDDWLDSRKIELTIYTRKFAIQKYLEHVKSNPYNYPAWKFKFSHWNDNQQPVEFRNKLREAEIVLIPSDSQDPRKLGASHNRLVDAIRSGCIVIASPLQSYCEFSDLETIGNDFCKILKTCIENPQYFHKKAESVRNQQLARFSPELNLKNWKKVIQIALHAAT